MKKKPIPSLPFVRRFISYDIRTGHITNAATGGRCSPAARGYRSIAVARHTYPAHCVVWFLHHGVWPQEVDHIDGDKGNNRLENLRQVTRSENIRHWHKRRGATGVRWDRQRNRWQATIVIEGRAIYLGSFTDYESARAARLAAEQMPESLLQKARTPKRTVDNANRRRSTAEDRGVSRHAYVDRWRAWINVDGKRVHLGMFTTKEDAIVARRNAEARHGST